MKARVKGDGKGEGKGEIEGGGRAHMLLPRNEMPKPRPGEAMIEFPHSSLP